MPYLPTCTIKKSTKCIDIGEYTIHGSYGIHKYIIYIIYAYICIPLIFSGSYKSSSRLGKLKTSTSSRLFKKVLKAGWRSLFFNTFVWIYNYNNLKNFGWQPNFPQKKIHPPQWRGTLWICPAAHQIALQSRESLQLQMYRHPWPLSGRPDPKHLMRPRKKSRRCVEKLQGTSGD